MKRILVLLLVLGLVFGAIASAEAGKKKKKKKPIKTEREAQGTYVAPATVVGSCSQTDGIGCMEIATGADEAYLTAKVTDEHGQPVAIRVSADLDGNNSTETTYGDFCGETEEPIQIDPGAAIIFWVGRVDVAATIGCLPGIGTQGTLDVVFSNLP